MFDIIDIHNHSLCGLDDGAESYETMCDMLELSYQSGVRGICFTPHYGNSDIDCTPAAVEAVFKQASDYCSKYIPDMRLYIGSEMNYHYDCIDSISEKKMFTLANSKYVLTDFLSTPDVRGIIIGVQRLLNCGYVPVIAHIERYPCLFGRLEDIRRISMLGAIIQINAGLMSKRRHQCMKLLSEGLVDIVASDTHNLSTRPPVLKECANYIISKFGYEYAEQIFYENPERIIFDRRI